jgi:tRNA (cytosine38-C5)-methyltransferase
VKVAGLRKDAGDARAFSFLQMLEMLPQMKFPPNYILVENVVGFEVSVTFIVFLKFLSPNSQIDLLSKCSKEINFKFYDFWHLERANSLISLCKQNSVTHEHLMDIFKELGFITQEIIISPWRLGIPYSRPRYFCLVSRSKVTDSL